MNKSSEEIARYPLLEALLRQKGLTPLGIYAIGDAAKIFSVSKRTIQEWIRDGKLVPRDLPGRGRFLSVDLELLLEGSLRRTRKPNHERPIPPLGSSGKIQTLHGKSGVLGR